MLFQSYFPCPVFKQKNCFYKKIIHISWISYLLSQRFLHLMTVILPIVRNNRVEEMNPQWDCIVSKNTCFQQISMGTEKKSKEIFHVKRIWKKLG